MQSKHEIEKELDNIKKYLKEVSTASTKSRELLLQNEKANETNSNLFALLKYMIEENKKTTMLLRSIAEGIGKLENEVGTYSAKEENAPVPSFIGTNKNAKEVLLSESDAKILQAIQLSPHSMACAEDIRVKLGYKGKNAASARLNKLYKSGLLERYQLGKRVYYKYDAGKATNILIVSPPQ
ncbi:MAG: winged helix-turn-helix domain-containing protein [Candidatus Micrarchaeaceae archaeon]